MSPSRAGLGGLLGHEFERTALLDEALTHPSAVGGGRSAPRPRDYERLEFLGDRVLGLVVADRLLARFGDADAGQLAHRYNALVRRETLADVAREIDLGAYLDLGKSERDGGGADRPALLANACEAVIGALYLDGGLGAAARFIHRYWDDRVDALVQAPKDAKTRLQEWAHAAGLEPLAYALVAREGADHDPTFTIEVSVPGVPARRGRGGSKREAEQAAAAALLAEIERRGPPAATDDD